MTQISPAIQEKLNTLPAALRTEILSRGVPLNGMSDLVSILEQIVREG